MIERIRHKGLRKLYKNDDPSLLNANHVERLRRILARLEIADKPHDLDMPGWKLHPLKGDMAGMWSVIVSGNWRVVFRFEGENITDVDLRDYH